MPECHDPYRIVGLMSGTSLDGIDAVLVEVVDGQVNPSMKALNFISLPFEKKVRDKIMELCNPEQAQIKDISAMNMLLGKLFADAARMVTEEAGYTLEQVDLISSHGQTIFHEPSAIQFAGHNIASTMQISDIGVIAERTGVTTVGDFRTRDMAVGGQGAPLVPFADYFMFRDEDKGRVLLNIGGIANITVLPKGCEEEQVLAYDTGPGNMLIDAFVQWATDGRQSFDQAGAIALSGKIHKEWLAELKQHTYFKKKAPKSTGREMFGIEYARDLWHKADKQNISHKDRIATITRLTADTIADEVLKHRIEEVFVSGGGWHNKALIQGLKEVIGPTITVRNTTELGFNGDAKEAMVFALLGYLCYKKKTNSLPTATGASKSVIMGKIAW